MNRFNKKPKNGLTRISQQWLKKLNFNLKKISKKERVDVINNYKTQISDELQQGKNEQTIVDNFDPINEITNNIYQELGINEQTKKSQTRKPLNRFFKFTVKFFGLLLLWVAIGIIPLILMITFGGLMFGSIGGFFFSFAVFKVYNWFIALGVLFSLLFFWILFAFVAFWITAICQKAFNFFLKGTINSLWPNSNWQGINKTLFKLAKKMWWKSWTIILGLTLIFGSIGAPLMLTKGGLGYNMINGVFINSQLVMDSMDKTTFETNYLTNPDEHIILDLAGNQTKIGAKHFISTADHDQEIVINGQPVVIKQNSIAIVRQYNTSRQYVKVTISKKNKFNHQTQKNEEVVQIYGKQETPNHEFCWEDIVFGFSLNAGYYTVYSPYDQNRFDNQIFS